MKKKKKQKQHDQPQAEEEISAPLASSPSARGTVTAPEDTSLARPAGGGTATLELAPALPETDEPRTTDYTLPVLIIALFGLLFYFADMYLMDHSGEFNALVYYPNSKVPTPPGGGVDGQWVYTTKAGCAACHQPNGAGSKAQNVPPLAGSEWVNAEGPNRIIRIVLHGLNGPIEVKGETWSNQMLPFGGILSDEEIAAVLSYVRQSWGNQASSVTTEQVKAIRDEVPEHAPWTAAELQRIPDSD